MKTFPGHMVLRLLLTGVGLLPLASPGLSEESATLQAAKPAGAQKPITPESIVRLSRIEVDPAHLPEYLALVTECGRESMAREPGVYMMFSMQEKAHPEQISILEIYADRAAYEHHLQTPHFQKYKQGTLKMVKRLDLLDQNPLVPEMKMK